jgi:hypothetical protein
MICMDFGWKGRFSRKWMNGWMDEWMNAGK